jgi:hypothetical protein
MVGPVQYVICLKDGHLTVTATMTAEVDDTTFTTGLVLSADCHATRGGEGLVGLITSVDMVSEGMPPDAGDMDSVLKDLLKLQKALADQPLALTFRIQGDALMIGNVRLPVVEGDHDLMEALQGLGGRYKRVAGDAVPKAKPVKPRESKSSPQPVLPPPPPTDEQPGVTYRIGVDFSTNPPRSVLVAEPVVNDRERNTFLGSPPPPPAPAPPAPSGPNPYPSAPAAVQPGVGFTGHVGAAVGLATSNSRCCPAAQPGKLALADIAELVKAGCGDEVILNQIRKTGSTYSLTVPDIKYLKQNAVSDSVIAEMQGVPSRCIGPGYGAPPPLEPVSR